MDLKSLPMQDRPREKLEKHGPQSLTDSELLALIIRTGSKNQDVLDLSSTLVKKYNLKRLSRLSLNVLKNNKGIGKTKASQIAACFELARRLRGAVDKKTKIICAKDAAFLLMEDMKCLDKEHLKVLFLDSKNRVNRVETIFIGSLNESVVHPREIFKAAIDEKAASIILVHNHPSGDPSPSANDIEATLNISKAGELMGIYLLDHVIIGDGRYFSMKEKGII